MYVYGYYVYIILYIYVYNLGMYTQLMVIGNWQIAISKDVEHWPSILCMPAYQYNLNLNSLDQTGMDWN